MYDILKANVPYKVMNVLNDARVINRGLMYLSSEYKIIQISKGIYRSV